MTALGMQKNFLCDSHGQTHVGKVRDHNEDALLDLGLEGIWVVADGAGGHDRGEVASHMIIQALAKLRRQDSLGGQALAVQQCLQGVNEQLIAMREHAGSRGILASTVCVLLLHHGHSVCLWSGDSRIYLLRDGKLSQLSRDHNRVDEFLAAGFSTQELSRFPVSRQLVRAVGVETPLALEIQMQECRAGDAYLLCSDGIYGEISDTEIQSLLLMGNSTEATVSGLIHTVLNRRAADNLTALLVRLKEVPV